MGKIKQTKRLSSYRSSVDPMGSKVPLADEIESLKLAKSKSNDQVKQQQNQSTRNKRQADQEDEYINEKMTAKILMQARKQQSELQDEYCIEINEENNELSNNNRIMTCNLNDDDSSNAASSNLTNTLMSRPFKKFQSNFKQQQKIRKSDHDDSDSDSDNDDNLDVNKKGFSGGVEEQEININEEDQKAFEMFMSNKSRSRRTIADIIMDKLAEKKTEIQSQMSQDTKIQQTNAELDERVVKMYTQIKEVLQKYRSGKLPKAFKILPSLSNWEHILYLTEPDNWSAAAVYQATRIFASNLNAKMAQRFFSLVLLPRIRDDINEYKRLNFHLYMALRKALFKPAAFFKGILLPLCESSDCNLREAIILGSVLAKNSIPMLHSAAALLKLAEMNYSGANSIFIRILLDKKYALPYRVIDAVVHHFVQFQNDSRQLPVLWHQSLLTFVQRYKSDISSEQKEALLELIKKQKHHELTNEIRNELINAKCRDLEDDDANSQHSIDLNFDDNDN